MHFYMSAPLLCDDKVQAERQQKKVEKFRESLQKTKDSFYKLSQAEGSQNYNKEYEELKNEIRQLDDMMLRLNGFKVQTGKSFVKQVINY